MGRKVRGVVVGKPFIRLKTVKEVTSRSKSKLHQLGANKLKTIKDPEKLLRKAVLISRSIQFLAQNEYHEEEITSTDDDSCSMEKDEAILDAEILREISLPGSLAVLEDLAYKFFSTDHSIVIERNHNQPIETYPNYNIEKIMKQIELPDPILPLDDFSDSNEIKADIKVMDGNDDVSNNSNSKERKVPKPKVTTS